MKYKDWLYDWLDNYIKPSAKTKTCLRYTENVERHTVWGIYIRETKSNVLKHLKIDCLSEMKQKFDNVL